MGKKKDTEMRFNDYIDELENIMKKLESSDIELEESILLYEKGMSLIKESTEKITKAEIKIKEIMEQHNGESEERAFELAEGTD